MRPGPATDEKGERAPSTKTSGVGCPDSLFERYAQPGVEEDSAMSADIEGLAPNFVRRPRGQSAFTQVEMQMGYDDGGRKMGKCEVVDEGFRELKSAVGDKYAKTATRIAEFTAFELRGFGCFKVELGTGAYVKELGETLKRKAAAMKELMYTKGIRSALTNRIINGLSGA